MQREHRPSPREAAFPLGAKLSLEQLRSDPHPSLARLREHEPVSWVPALDAWLVTRHDLALEVMRDADAFTVDDPRFSTALVVGPSMLSLDGLRHARHRAPFVAPFRPAQVRERFAEVAAQQAELLLDRLAPARAAELRREFAGPMAGSIIAVALGLELREVPSVLAWYEAIVGSVTSITAGAGATVEGEQAVRGLRARLERVVAGDPNASLLAAAASRSGLTNEEITSNAAVLLFGGIETTEGMIANAILQLLELPEQLELVRRDPRLLDAAIDESLRLEPAAAVIDRYASAELALAGASIARRELVRVSIAAANRDPAVFDDPDRFRLDRANGRRHLAFAQGPHVCVGIHLARLEARAALAALLRRLPGLRLDPQRSAAPQGLVFRKPPQLDVVW
ncbi:MAG: cytochrome P450 [Solirubrobacterales bacterium]|nr:cytochrome P450 [Solirubrobacterales bacterium]